MLKKGCWNIPKTAYLDKKRDFLTFSLEIVISFRMHKWTLFGSVVTMGISLPTGDPLFFSSPGFHFTCKCFILYEFTATLTKKKVFRNQTRTNI